MRLEDYLHRHDIPNDLKDAILQDMDEKRRLRKAMKSAEEKLRCIVEQNVAGICIVQNSKFVYVNSKFAEIFGYTPEAMCKMKSNLDVIHPDHRGMVAENIMKRVFGDTSSIHYKIKGVRKDGQTILLDAHGTATDYNGKPSIIAVVIDVTDNISEINGRC